MLAILSTTAVRKFSFSLKLLCNGAPFFSCSRTHDHSNSKPGFGDITASRTLLMIRETMIRATLSKSTGLYSCHQGLGVVD